MQETVRELPAHLSKWLSKQDLQLNQQPAEQLIDLYRLKAVKLFVDRGMLITAASAGVPLSGLAIVFSFLFTLLPLAAPFAWYFFSWIFALGCMIAAVISYKISRALIVANVQKYALNHPQVLDFLVSKGTIWFEYISDGSLDAEQQKNMSTFSSKDSTRVPNPWPANEMYSTIDDIPPFFDLPAHHDGWHDVLDSIVEKLKPIVAEVFPNDKEGSVEAKCELIAYAAAYEGMLEAGSDIDVAVWNMFVHSIENRIAEWMENTPSLSGLEEAADGSQAFVSYSSVYISQMKDLETIIDKQYHEKAHDHSALLSIFVPPTKVLLSELEEDFNEVFQMAVILCEDEIIPTLEDYD